MKKILISVSELDCGGTEVSLISLLKNLDENKYDITLLLARKRGVYLSRIPSYVKIIEIPFIKESNRYYISNDNSITKNIFNKIRIKVIRKVLTKIDTVLKKIDYKYDLQYNFILKKTDILVDNYDLAIDYLGYGYFQSAYIGNKVNAKHKLMWIHDERLDAISKVRCYFDKYSHFFGVSQSCADIFSKTFPEVQGKVSVFHNIIDGKEVLKKSYQKISSNLFLENNFNLVTVGRLEWQKGYDLALEVAKELDKKNIKFIWYILGEGSCRKELEEKINLYKLNEKIILLGRVDNPYPYIKECNLYIQPSRHEGYGLAIAEARILNKCVLATDLGCVREQIKDEINGYLLPFEVKEFSNKIEKLYYNRDLINKIEKNLKVENIIQEKEIYKLDEFLKDR